MQVRNSWYLYIVMKRSSHYRLHMVYHHPCLDEIQHVELDIVMYNNALQGDVECHPWFSVAVMGNDINLTLFQVI